ncbi:MAG: rhomboid family intramembrane serine protease [Gammaproteobacteria bacterium]|nr:rhomboid family intramembrane serine protease [Gammaproteobacteria bacterium]
MAATEDPCSLGQINSLPAARLFCDYLTSCGIAAHAQATAMGAEIVLADSAQHSRALAELQVFLANPSDSKYRAAAWQVAAPDTVTTEQRSKSSIINRAWQQTPPVTKWIGLLAVVITVASGFGNNALIDWLYFDWADILSGQVWRLLTPALLHFAVWDQLIIHLLFNVLMWWWLATIIERQIGSKWLLNHFVWIAITSNIAQQAVMTSGAIFGGLSGVVYGLFAYLYLRGRLQPSFYSPIQTSMAIVLVMLMGLGFTGVLGNVANTAHWVGALSGAVLGFVDARWRKSVTVNQG